MRPSFAAPPAPQVFLSVVASTSSCAGESGNPVITETPLPPRPATSRPTRTRAALLIALFGASARLDVIPPLRDRRHAERPALFVDEMGHPVEQSVELHIRRQKLADTARDKGGVAPSHVHCCGVEPLRRGEVAL